MKIKHTLLNILFLFFLLNSNYVFSNDWTAINKPTIINDGKGYSTYDISYCIDIDASGNYYIAGFFDGRIGFGSDTLESTGGRDIFVAKMNSSGYFFWARKAGGTSAELARDIAVDNSGNVYITGYYYGTAKFGNYTITANRNSDIFVAKLNSSGTWQWAKSAGGIGFDRGNAITVESNGTVYITGSFENTSTFGTVSLNSVGSKDIFISKLSSSGNWIWSVKAGGTQLEEPASIKYNPNINKIFLAGFFSGNATFGSNTLNSSGQRDGFLCKMDSSGSFNSSIKLGGVANDEVKNVKIDALNKVLVVGTFEALAIFGADQFTSSGYKDAFLCIVNENLVVQKALQAGGSNDDEFVAVGIDTNSNIYLAGNFYGSIDFGSQTLTSNGDKDSFIAKINPDDEYEWAIQASSTSTVEVFGLVCNPIGNTAITGSFIKDATFGTNTVYSSGESDIYVANANSDGEFTNAIAKSAVLGVINSNSVVVDKFGNKYLTGGFYGTVAFGLDTLSSNGYEDVFIAKMNKDNNFVWAKKAGGDDNDRGKGIACDTFGNIYVTGYFSNNFIYADSTIQSNGFSDIFVLKLDSLGNLLKIQSAGSDMPDVTNSIALSNNGNVYLTGLVSNNVTFGDIQLSDVGEEDIFVAKLNEEFEWLWAVNAVGNGWDAGNAIAVDSAENIFITGYFDENASFGSINLNGYGFDDIFVARLDNSGNWIWAKASGSSITGEQGFAIVLDNNSMYVAGHYKNIAPFGAVSLISKGGTDAFIAKLNYNGTWLWAKSIGGTMDDEGKSLSIYKGNIYFAGNFSSTFIIGDSTFTNQGGKDIFLISYNNNGAMLWKQTTGLNYDDEIEMLSIDNESNATLFGSFYHSTKFGNLQFENFGPKNKNSFIAKFGLIPPNSSWTFKNNTSRSSQIFVPTSTNPKFNHRPLQSGDAIGVFYTRNSNYYCAGWAQWNGNDLTINVSGDDLNTLTKDGMASNESYAIKLWDATRGTDTLISVRFLNNNKYYSDNNFSEITRLPDYDDTLKIPLKSGWNMISTSVYPYRNPTIDSVFKPIKNKIKIVKNISGKVYIPDNNLNTIGNWNHKEGYMVYAASADTLRIIGMRIDKDTVQINMTKGWNMLPALIYQPTNLPSIVQSLVQSGNLKIVKNISGKVYLPENNLNTIGNMLPSEAYQIYMIESQTFQFP